MAEKTAKKNTKGTKKAVEKKVAPKKETKKVTKKAPVKKEVKTKVEAKAAEKEVKIITSKKKEEGKVKAFCNKIIANRPFAISLCIILVLVIALIVTICVKRIPKTSNGSQIVASVKGKTITADDLYLALKDEYGTDKVINMIDTYIASKEVKLSKKNKEYLKSVVESWKEQAKYYGVSLKELIANYGLTIEDEDDFYNYLEENYRISLAVVKFIGDQASEEDLKAYYKNNFSDTLTVRHILIQVDGNEKEAYDKAVNIIKELDDVNSKDLEKEFIELAKDYSDDTGSANDGGLIKDVTKATVVSEFFEAADKLKDGEYTKEPVKSSYGYHIIYRVDSTKLEKYEDIKDEVKQAYGEAKLNEDASLQTSKWNELRKSYKLNIVDSDIKDAYEKKIK